MNFFKKHSKIIPIFSLIVGVLLVLLGLYRGEYQTVLTKATRICMECIGIG